MNEHTHSRHERRPRPNAHREHAHQHPAHKHDRKLSPEEINRLEPAAFEGPIRVISSLPQMLEAVKELRRETLLGFDIETRPSFRKGETYPPALLQLAGASTVFLFRLTELGLPPELSALLADPGIVKAGVAVDRDIRDLATLAEFKPAGFVDLGVLAEQRGVQHHGLRGLAAFLLGRRISKGAKMTRWDLPHLPRRALVYAATDAWIGREIFLALKKDNRPGAKGRRRTRLWRIARVSMRRIARLARPRRPQTATNAK